MDACRSCGATLSLGASDCAGCGTLVRPEPPGPGTGEQLDPNLDFFANLLQGNYGLGTTYWLYGVLIALVYGAVVGVVIAVSASPVVTLLGVAAIAAYQALVSLAIWRAAAKYPGSKVWAVLARVAVVVAGLRVFEFAFRLLVGNG